MGMTTLRKTENVNQSQTRKILGKQEEEKNIIKEIEKIKMRKKGNPVRWRKVSQARDCSSWGLQER